MANHVRNDATQTKTPAAEQEPTRPAYRVRSAMSGLFDDLTVPQVIAGALAAITSMLFASSIGVYGSVIGAGVGSIVAAITSQLYKKFIAASAEHIRELPTVEKIGARTGIISRSDEDQVIDDEQHLITEELMLEASEDLAVAEDSEDPVAMKDFEDEDPAAMKDSEDLAAAEDFDIADSKTLRHWKRRVIVVAIVSALVAVALSAAVVYVITLGEGLGAKPEPIRFSAVKTEVLDKDASQGATTGQSSSKEASSIMTPTDSSSDAHVFDDSSSSSEQTTDDSSSDAEQNNSDTASSADASASSSVSSDATEQPDLPSQTPSADVDPSQTNTTETTVSQAGTSQTLSQDAEINYASPLA